MAPKKLIRPGICGIIKADWFEGNERDISESTRSSVGHSWAEPVIGDHLFFRQHPGAISVMVLRRGE